MNDMPNTYTDDTWDNRELGATQSFVRKASVTHEVALDDKLNLHVISIRLQKNLIDELKELASADGLGYQPYIRQLLAQHVRHEKIKRYQQSQFMRK